MNIHFRILNKAPTKSCTKAVILKYLIDNGCDPELMKDWKKPALVKKLMEIRPSQQTPAVDKLLRENGIILVRLPPYFCVYNPIEHIWSSVKGEFRNENTGDLNAVQAKALIARICDNKPKYQQMWKDTCEHVIKAENKDRAPVDRAANSLTFEDERLVICSSDLDQEEGEAEHLLL